MFLRTYGYCCVCEDKTVFVSRYDWLRDHYLCERCKTIPRVRALVNVLNFVAPTWRQEIIHESSPGSRFFADRCAQYSYSFYYEDVPLGGSKNGNPCQSLEGLTFPNESFDIFITQDVMEHVFNPDVALREVMRVLRPNGIHIFTAPKWKDLQKSRRRASLINGAVTNHLPAEYHGNPISDKGSLVTWDYGADVDDLFQAWSGYCTSNFTIRDRRLGIDGEFLDVFVTRKSLENALPRPEA